MTTGNVSTTTKAVPFSVEHIKPHCPNIQLPTKPEGLSWGFRFNSPDFTSKHSYRWPFPGRWAHAPGPFSDDRDNPCPLNPGDGICVALDLDGAQSGGNRPMESIGLLVAWRPADLLASSVGKVRVRKAWVADVFSPRTALIAAALTGADLRGANLYGADLRGADLRGANLRGVNLYGADLRGADLRGANLYGANLYGADLRGADLRGANLRGVNLYGADLRGADLRGANLYGADLRGADLRGANLRGANLYGANLRGADLRGANLYGANLYGANLYGARYSQLTSWPTRCDPLARGAIRV